ncbi:DUF6345 domain-containing protein [Mucilaginibacter arboris]|uniref:Uncharacterized protein n=1 Tax=Mucilaginibacter arboris TaxID=2682090 RepID=A0A7K1ST68_9SPHI|nr:DUF6345 domain-containing protein [Mucilaginibacter arboris]MVN20506.1 hypothetical protein [Mucilaginibacter arboris]
MKNVLEDKAINPPFDNNSTDKNIPQAAAPNNLLGLCSIQDFSGSLGNHNSDLHATHADAQGFYNYLYNWYTANYYMKDGAVQTWLYEEPNDHWQNYYGIDAVDVFYHSGHGAMTANGIFQAPTGGKWNNETWISSNHNMLMGNQRLRYIFWSTCFSCRVFGGITPITTWWNDDSNPGFRMLFGFETTSFDNPNYGSNFWNHYKAGQSFSTSWLYGSWDISHNQTPTVVASGATQAEATNIVMNEKLFQWGTVARNWYQWRWLVASSVASHNKMLPKEMLVAELAPFKVDHAEVGRLADQLGFSGKAIDGFGISKEGTYVLDEGEKKITINQQGHFNAKLANVNFENRRQLDQNKARQTAEQYMREQLGKDTELQFQAVRLGKTCGGSTKGSGKLDEEYVTDTTIEFRQVINGVPVVNTDNGVVRVTIDNDGTITNFHNSVKKVLNLSNKPKQMPIDPNRNGHALETRQDTEQLFAKKLAEYKTENVKPISDEIGYDVSGRHGGVVAKREYEVTFENDLKKSIQVIVPIFA